jgi:hypothetical protein
LHLLSFASSSSRTPLFGHPPAVRERCPGSRGQPTRQLQHHAVRRRRRKTGLDYRDSALTKYSGAPPR